MEFLAISRPVPGAAHDRIGSRIPDHLEWVARQLHVGDIIRAGRWGKGGTYTVVAPDEATATTIVGEDPLVASGLVQVEMAVIVP